MDWMKNVLAGGKATVVTHGRTYGVDQPRVVPMTEATRFFAAKEQKQHRRYEHDTYDVEGGRHQLASMDQTEDSVVATQLRRIGIVDRWR